MEQDEHDDNALLELDDADFLTDSDGEVPLEPPRDRCAALERHAARVERWRREPHTDPHMQRYLREPPRRVVPARQRAPARRYTPPPAHGHPVAAVLVLQVRDAARAQRCVQEALDGDAARSSHRVRFTVRRGRALRDDDDEGDCELQVEIEAGVRATTLQAARAAQRLRRLIEHAASSE